MFMNNKIEQLQNDSKSRAFTKQVLAVMKNSDKQDIRELTTQVRDLTGELPEVPEVP